MRILRTQESQSGKIQVTAAADGLLPDTVTLTSQN